MQVDIKIIIDDNLNLKRYLKENSIWYRYLNRDPSFLKIMSENMKKEYKLTTEDKLGKMNDGIGMISEILKILK